MITGAQCLFCLGDIGLAWRILECGAPRTLSRSPDTFTSNTFNTFPQDSHSPVPALRAPWTAFFSRVSTITEPCFTGTHRRALPVMRNAYCLVGLDGECGHMIVEAASPGFSPTLSSKEVYISDSVDTHCTYIYLPVIVSNNVCPCVVVEFIASSLLQSDCRSSVEPPFISPLNIVKPASSLWWRICDISRPPAAFLLGLCST